MHAVKIRKDRARYLSSAIIYSEKKNLYRVKNKGNKETDQI